VSETANKGKIFDHHMLNEKCKDYFIKTIVDIVLFATQIPLSMFTNLFHQRFEKAFNVEINSGSIIAVLYSYGVRTR
jgi:hypothetical protein